MRKYLFHFFRMNIIQTFMMNSSWEFYLKEKERQKKHIELNLFTTYELYE